MEINLEHGRYANFLRQLDSDAGRALLRFRDKLVLQLFFKHGPFWNAVRDVRTRWNIKAAVSLPPERARLFGPEDVSKRENYQALQKWENELYNVVQREIPQRYSYRDFEVDWKRFVSACIIYDPPETDLLAYADRSGPSPYGFAPSIVNRPGNDPTEPLLAMQAPPIRRLRDPAEAQQTERWFWRRVVSEIGKRHLQPLGLDIWDLFNDVVNNVPELMREYRERHGRNRPCNYILVDEHTTTRDVDRGLQLLAAARQERSQGGASPRAPLIAIQCAILYDRHNGKDPQDARRKKWTHEKLSEHLGLASARAAREYVREGRKLLQANPQQEE